MIIGRLTSSGQYVMHVQDENAIYLKRTVSWVTLTRMCWLIKSLQWVVPRLPNFDFRNYLFFLFNFLCEGETIVLVLKFLWVKYNVVGLGFGCLEQSFI